MDGSWIFVSGRNAATPFCHEIFYGDNMGDGGDQEQRLITRYEDYWRSEFGSTETPKKPRLPSPHNKGVDWDRKVVENYSSRLYSAPNCGFVGAIMESP